MKHNRKLRSSLMALLGVSALTAVSFSASAATVLTLDGASASGNLVKLGWNGSNNGNQGWAHNSDWYTLQVPASGKVDIKVTGTVSAAQPAFTVWSSSTDVGSGAPGAHSYNQIGNTSWLNATFVGFANNTNLSSLAFGSGPQNLTLGGLPALAGTVANVGADANGNQFAELIFSSSAANTWYTIAVGGSGGAGGYTISAATAPVPVPAAVYLLGSALAGIGVIGRKRNAKS